MLISATQFKMEVLSNSKSNSKTVSKIYQEILKHLKIIIKVLKINLTKTKSQIKHKLKKI